jgi:hypothetical protein
MEIRWGGRQEQPGPERRGATFEINCWKCGESVHLAASARPSYCPYCAALLCIDWPGSGSYEWGQN